jgi:hypothetical protein
MILFVLDTSGFWNENFIAPSAGGFKKRLRGIESGAKMIYNESNKAVNATALFLFSGMF